MAAPHAVALPSVSAPRVGALSSKSLAVAGLLGLATLRTVLISPRWGNLGHQATRLELIVLVLGAAYLFVRPRPRAPAVLTVALLGLIAVDTFDVLWQQLPLSVLYVGVNAYLRYFLLAFIVYALAVNERDMEAVLKLFAPAFMALALLTVVQFATGHAEHFFLIPSLPAPARAGIRQGVGVFAWPDAWAFFCGAWFFVYFARRSHSRAFLITALLLALAVGLTLTRWCIAVLLALLVLYFLKQRRARWRALALTLMIAVAGVLYGNQIKTQFSDLHFYTSGKAARTAYMREGVRVFLSRPLITLTGVGYYRFGRAVPYAIDDPRTTPYARYTMNGMVIILATTDSIIASLLPEFGIAGLALLLGFFAVVLRRGARWAKTNPAARGYVYCMVFVLLSSLTDGEGFFAPRAALFWVAAGLILGATRDRARHSLAQPEDPGVTAVSLAP